MEDYKNNVFKGDNFEFQNSFWENKYAEYVKEKKAKDQKHQADLKEHESNKAEFEKKVELKRKESSVGIN